MKKYWIKSKIFVLLILIIFLAMISINIPYKQALVFITPENNNDIPCYVPISAGETFKIKYKHSIHLSDVIESYEVTETHKIRQYELEYEDFAIGMPSETQDGENFEMKDGKYYITNMSREFAQFDMRLGQVRANHTLIYENITYPLSKAIEPGSRVRIKIEKISLLKQLEGVNILDDK